MKKIATLLVLSLVLSVSVFAEGDGDIHTGGGKTCPPGQQTCLIGDTTNSGEESENTTYQDIFNFLKSIFE